MSLVEHIGGADQLVSLFGSWPSFHDAEVIWMRFDRKSGEQGGPTLEVLIHLFQMTGELTAEGCYALKNHHLTVLRFQGVDALRMEGFNHQNALFELVVVELPTDQSGPGRFEVRFESAFGVDASFHCWAVEVVSVVPCDPDGQPIPIPPDIGESTRQLPQQCSEG